jgi:UDP-N-acetyl-D-galactosamine dehydrogenase
MKLNQLNLSIIGLGYVGLPLAVAFSRKFSVICYDNNSNRINQLKEGIDETLEVKKKDLKNNENLIFTDNVNDLKKSNCYIITVPTLVKKNKTPDLKPLIKATNLVGKFLSKKSLVIFESTVFPGCTEEVCVPLLEKKSGLKYNQDFFCGYSPERINPGDKKHNILNTIKITSGSNKKISNLVNKLYNQIVLVGTYKAESIKIAESAKIIENIQRDVNIALINEFSILFNKLNIDTLQVLKAAETKWNFLPFKPGLVGGHCIAVNPYYFTYRARKVKYFPKVILSARKVNNGMANYVVMQLIQKMKEKKININNSKILIMGITFKENFADMRNSEVFNIIKKLKKYSCKINVYDPFINLNEAKKFIKDIYIEKLKHNTYDGIIIAVAHNQFKRFGLNLIAKLGKKKKVIYDLKSIFRKNNIVTRL